jgi:hypothetical protein
MVAWIKEQYNNMKTARVTVQRQWYINLSMYYGRQYLEAISSYGVQKLMTPAAPKHRVRQTVNLIRPMIRTEIARMTSQKPTATSTPATTSDDDMFAAQAAEQVWEYLQQRRRFQQKMVRNAFWTAICGVGFIKTWWDADLIDPSTLDATTKQPIQGDVCFGVSTPFNVFIPDLLEQDIEDQPYVFEAYTKSVEWVKEFWGLETTPSVASRNELIDTSYFEKGGTNDAKPDSVLVIEAWVKKGGCKEYPEGGMFTIVGDELVSSAPLYNHGEFPYAKFEHIPTGKFYSDSVLVDINPLQRGYNRIKSQVTESLNRMARPQLLSPKGAIDPNKVTSEPGLIIEYLPFGNKPEPLPMQAIPSYVLEEMDRLRSEMEDISGQHAVSTGQAPGSGVTAATAISFLQERDDSMMGTTYDSIEAGVEKIARHSLQLVVDYWDMPRIIGTTGLDQSFDALELKGTDVANGKNIRVEGGSSLPSSKAARQALLMDMVKLGIISGDQFLDMLEIGGTKNITDLVRVDLRQAQRENLKMKRVTQDEWMQYMSGIQRAASQGGVGTTDPNTGMPIVDPSVPATYPPMVPVNEWDNHQVHIQTHNNYRKSQEFDTLPDFVKDQFSRHVNLHMMALGQGMGQPPGMPPQPGLPPGGMGGVPQPGGPNGGGQPPNGQPPGNPTMPNNPQSQASSNQGPVAPGGPPPQGG